MIAITIQKCLGEHEKMSVGPVGPEVCRTRMRTGEVRQHRCYVSGNESEVLIRVGRLAAKGWRCVWACEHVPSCIRKSWRIRHVGGPKKGGEVTWRGGTRCENHFLRRRSLGTCRCRCHLTRFGRCGGCRRHPAAYGGRTARWSLRPPFPRRA